MLSNLLILAVIVLALDNVLVRFKRKLATKVCNDRFATLESETADLTQTIRSLRHAESERKALINQRTPSNKRYKANYRVDWFSEGKQFGFYLSFVWVYADDEVAAKNVAAQLAFNSVLKAKNIQKLEILKIEEA